MTKAAEPETAHLYIRCSTYLDPVDYAPQSAQFGAERDHRARHG